jgi:hypothetical protein
MYFCCFNHIYIPVLVSKYIGSLENKNTDSELITDYSYAVNAKILGTCTIKKQKIKNCRDS